MLARFRRFDGALFKAFGAELRRTVRKVRGGVGAPGAVNVANAASAQLSAEAANDIATELLAHADALDTAWQRVEEVTQSLYAVGDMNKTLANASAYLEAVGHVVLAWIWLQQAFLGARALADANVSDVDFYRGKLQACRFFYRWELPKVAQQLELLASVDTTTLDMQDAWF